MSSEASLSALRENIQRKGKNAYYYAHSHTASGPEWDGREEPRLLSSSPSPSSSGASASSGVVRKKVKSIDSYGWSDGKKTVKILVDMENAQDIPDEDIVLTSTESSIELRISRGGEEHGLAISPFYEEIESASFKKKESRVDVILKKKVEMSWHELRKKS